MSLGRNTIRQDFLPYLRTARLGASKSISRVLYPELPRFPPRYRWVGFRVVTIHLAPTLPSGSSDQPEGIGRAPQAPFYSVLLRVGFAQPTSHPVAGELLPHHFTLAPKTGAVCFCGTFRRVTPPGRYPAPCPVELGLSSPYSWYGAATRFTCPEPSL